MSAVPIPEPAKATRGSRISAVRRSLSSPPGFLRAISVTIAIGAIFLGIFGGLRAIGKTSDIDKIGNHTIPSIIDAQRIHAALLDADRNAANSYLHGGEGTDPAHELYLADILLATEALEQAAQHTAYGDEVAPPLVKAMSGLNRYTALVERARANSRLGYPVGQAYLTAASRLMHDEVLPAIEQLNAINAAHLEMDYARASVSTMTLAVVLGLGALVLAQLVYLQIYVTRRFRRRFNFMLIQATVLLLVALTYSSVGIFIADSNLTTAKSNHFAQAHRLWMGRSLVNDANLNETLSLIARGSGTEFDLAFDRSQSAFQSLLGIAATSATNDDERRTLNDVRSAYEQFLAVDARIRTLAAGGQRNEAVKLALGNEPGQLGHAFAQLDTALGRAIDINQNQFNQSIGRAQQPLGPMPFILAFCFLSIAYCTLAGVQPRIKEYGG